MGVLDTVRVMIYRFHEKGLEIFLLNNEMENDPQVWRFPEGINDDMKHKFSNFGKEAISLETISNEEGVEVKTVAIEGDWHEIPSIRGMIKHDIRLVKKIVKERLPGSEKGSYFAVKEAFKKVLPHEYEAIKELKDILADRNAVKNI